MDAFTLRVQTQPVYPAYLPPPRQVLADSLLIPLYATLVSADVLFVRAVLSSAWFRRRFGRTESQDAKEEEQERERLPWKGRLKEHAASHGGGVALTLGILRSLCCAALAAFALTGFVLERLARPKGAQFDVPEWVDVALCVTFVYTFVLSLVSVSTRPKGKVTVSTHVSLVLFVTWAVFFVRDILPLATYTQKPKDIVQGWLLWSAVGTLTAAACIIPLVTPSRYIPKDPKNPMPPTPDQLASPLAYVLFTFLDPLIRHAHRVEHITLADLPPLADYDAALPLIREAFPRLDPELVPPPTGLSARFSRHTRFLFATMRVFREEYVVMALYQVLQVFATIASPYLVNNLLMYLDTRERVAPTVRPWVWVVLMFLAPLARSILDNQYFLAYTAVQVHMEAIMTQLVLEHALRVRVIAETPEGAKKGAEGSSKTASPASEPESPDTAVGEPLALDPENSHALERAEAEATDGQSETASTTASTIVASTTKSRLLASKGKTTEAKKDDEEKSADNLIGKMNNLISTDLQKIGTGADFLQATFLGPLMIIAAASFLYSVLGWSAFVGLVLTVVLLPVPIMTAKLLARASKEVAKRSDGRVGTVTESISVIRMVKLFAWEGLIGARIADKRREELGWIWRRKILQLLTFCINFTIPAFTMVATYGTYTLVMKRTLDAATVFSSISAFNILRGNISRTFYYVPQLISAKVSIDRIADFLADTELLDRYTPAADVPEGQVAVAVAREADPDAIGFGAATFTWSNAEAATDGAMTPSRRRFRLRIDDELLFQRGKINLVIGATGSGKTSLLMALLGEMHFIRSGPNSWYNLPRSRGVAYAAQESWVLNDTIKDNILFGAPLDEERYNKVIKQCGLERDLTLFKAGDLTEVGEKGLTLSGGQKARVTLARAIYSSAEILLLDDVLAALDVHTAKWIVDKCFEGDLCKGRTIILVTHNVAMTSPIADYVVSMGSDGRILSKGSMSDALANDKNLRLAVAEEKHVEQKAEKQVDDDTPEVKMDEEAGKLVMEEETAVGHLSWSSMMLYFGALGGDHVVLFWVLLVVATIAECTIEVVQPWFLGYWATQYDLHPGEVNAPLWLHGGYALLAVAMILIFFLSAGAVLTWGTLSASKTLHEKLMDSVLGTTLRWLDKTPTSRIITRCTQDVQSIDTQVPDLLSALNEMTALLLVRYFTVLIMVPRFGLLGVIVIIAGGALGQLYIKAQLSVKRELSKAKAPVMAHFGAAVEGITSIRAYGAQDAFKTKSIEKVNEYTRASRTNVNLNRVRSCWIGIRIDGLGALFSTSLALWFVYGSSKMNASNSGFSLSMAVSVGSLVLQWVRVCNMFEVQGNSIERIHQYLEIEHEPKPLEGGAPPAYWPSSGDLRVEKMSARYSEGGPRVLHEISFHIKSGERVGVVGRTGSGKSSLTLSLLRCIVVEGEVYYDGIPITSLNLDALRSNVTIIPQIPELLSGTLRSNLDPFDQYDDATLNSALRSAGLYSLQTGDEEDRLTLDSAIARGGSNLSVGQRQIIALARAMARETKLLILDEATSAIDYKTDSIIQESLRNELKKDVTVLTIAHRLQTIMDADKIMVLDAGRVIEFDAPSELLKNKSGLLRALVDESGDREALYAAAGVKA